MLLSRLPALALSLGLSLSLPAMAHFQELIPSAPALTQNRHLSLELTFTHPMAGGPVMPMQRPEAFGVIIAGGKAEDLSGQLQPLQRQGADAYRLDYQVRQPGDHLFYLSPATYWEPDENKLIRHYTKVVVDAFSNHQGWDTLVGFPTEIEPLTRPYGLWTGNLFRGRVLRHGSPLPFGEVEVEWRNDGSITAPTDAHQTQLIKADAAGVFAYALPRAGWWGFSALSKAEGREAAPDGTQVPVEEAGLIWIHARDMQ
ncbi:DUF4198 domain-containing protein [Motiliproteus sp. SC1-56]|uniref:DUF4198 domain-containing protein n=1 Tax=Motiliproteus sp. SC1-56 TaxID=2799565 RepID=UPI001A8EDE8A|nr:DUF4198 domain-containing protein [Motiliproteus sp. SC1-56]